MKGSLAWRKLLFKPPFFKAFSISMMPVSV
jgi:hypothetical protein